MAYYADLFEDDLLQAQGDDVTELSPFAQALAQQWLSTAQPELQAQGIGNASASIVRALARLPWFAPLGFAVARRFVIRSLQQVDTYLSVERVRQAAQDRVLSLITSETKVVVAHSLGSVVAFEACHKKPRLVKHLVTLGSPLGLPRLIQPKIRPQPPTVPDGVERWSNFAAPDDVVAAVHSLAGAIGRGSTEVVPYDELVENGSEPHSATHYLSKAKVGHAIAFAFD